MNSCCENYCFSDSDLFGNTGKVSNNKHINIVSCETLTEDRFPNFIFILECAGFVNKLAEVRITIWIAMCDIYCIIVVFGGVLKSETIVVLTIAVVTWLNG